MDPRGAVVSAGLVDRITQFPSVPGWVLAEDDSQVRPVETEYFVTGGVEPFGHSIEVRTELDGDVTSDRGVVIRVFAQVDLCPVGKLEPFGHRKVLRRRYSLITKDVNEEGSFSVLTADWNGEVDMVELWHRGNSSAGGQG